MIFESLWESARKGELLLLEGGMCRWHLRQDGAIVIYEIISLRPGAGQEMLAQLAAKQPRAIVAKCPEDLEANAWYQRRGFSRIGTEVTRSGRHLVLWRLPVQESKAHDIDC